MTRDFVEEICCALEGKEVGSLSFRIREDMTRFMLDVVCPLWEGCRVRFGVADDDSILVSKWIAQGYAHSPAVIGINMDIRRVMLTKEMYNSGCYTEISINR